jgi:hypothetical protein
MATARRCDRGLPRLESTPFLSEILVVPKATVEAADGWRVDRSSRVDSSA